MTPGMVRARQLGVLRAIGVRPPVMWWELPKESALLGARENGDKPLGLSIARVPQRLRPRYGQIQRAATHRPYES
jgi:hypothetical protein